MKSGERLGISNQIRETIQKDASWCEHRRRLLEACEVKVEKMWIEMLIGARQFGYRIESILRAIGPLGDR